MDNAGIYNFFLTGHKILIYGSIIEWNTNRSTLFRSVIYVFECTSRSSY